jgi:hypothetical protein
MKPAFLKAIVELYISRCDYSMVVDRKNIEMTIRTHLWSSDGRGQLVEGIEGYIEDWITYVTMDLVSDDRVTFVTRKEEFEYKGRKFNAQANYILNKKYACYLEALLAEIDRR